MHAEKATVAILDSTGTNGDPNVLGYRHTVNGFDHNDCEVFSGDSTNWIPRFTGGSLDFFKNKTIVIEIKLFGGEIYSVSGNLEPLMNTEAARYRVRGRIR